MTVINDERFQVEGVRFVKQGQLDILEVDNACASAKITPFGACVLSYRPKQTDHDLLWVSPTAVYDGSKPVRGGVPVCWPWFGAHPSEADKPAHGFVRSMVWQLDQVNAQASGATEILFSCHSSTETLAIWPYAFKLELRIEVGNKLSMTLTTSNLSDSEMVITEALHSYFNITDANGLVITGLEGSSHLDKLSHAPAETQNSAITLNPPMDSVYINHTSDAVIHDAGHQRDILIEKQSAASSVVWNPGPEIVKGFSDIPHDQWSTFVCVEAGNIFDNAVKVPAGQQHILHMQISQRPA